ncbi:hypothetical protein ACQPZF_13925 [Actinosynnema sp. CS-041913]|uniref:hypothetical protein n=1 Tax=Actinosynnema sp. CS-041913 TaxID=3239917 RepID=UPI003D8C9ADF
MTTETENPTWGEEPPPQAAAPGPSWTPRKTLIAVAVAVGIAAVGGGVIYAAGNSEAAQMGGMNGKGGNGLMVMGPGPFGDTAHGEFQNGEVTEVGDSSITVKSTDGFTETYQITDDTRVNGGQGNVQSLATGDQVMVVSNGDNTAQTIMENDGRGGRGNGQQPPGNNKGGDQGNQGNPGNQGDGQGQQPTR